MIVRRPAEEHAKGHGSGSWKVAYADFVTAMMAFFLLLWLLTMLEPDKRGRLADFFTEYSLIQTLKGEQNTYARPEDKESPPTTLPPQAPSPRQAQRMPFKRQATSQEISDRLATAIESSLADVKDQVIIERDPDGVRIEVVDKEGRFLFERGNSEPTPLARRVLKVLGETLAGFDNKVALTGHTDALPFAAGSRYTNWELSTFRALAARRELDTAGFDSKRLTRVSGAAEIDPLVKQDPRDPRNRRISLRVLAGETEREQKEPRKPFSLDIKPPGS